jgi:hypothetical protein
VSRSGNHQLFDTIKIKIDRFSMYLPAKSTFLPFYSYQDTLALLPISNQTLGFLLSLLTGGRGKISFAR